VWLPVSVCFTAAIAFLQGHDYHQLLAHAQLKARMRPLFAQPTRNKIRGWKKQPIAQLPWLLCMAMDPRRVAGSPAVEVHALAAADSDSLPGVLTQLIRALAILACDIV
jgi:hypothetical protein